MANTKDKTFKDFLLSEYDNISKAHFESLSRVTSFFRFYLLIISAPSVIILVVAELSKYNLESFLTQSPDKYYLSIILGLFLLSLATIGFLMSLSIFTIRSDSILYARTVNGIRNYYYSEFKIDLSLERSIRTLPSTTHQPRYSGNYTFIPVVCTFALINSLYFVIGSYLISNYGYEFYNSILPFKVNWLIPLKTYYVLFLFGLSFLFHILAFKIHSYRKETKYLRSHIIGIDIDGVLNHHRERFCELLFEKTGKKLKPDEITKIPVHYIPGTDVTEVDEHVVFNQLTYWTEMKKISTDNDFYSIDKIRKRLGFKVFIFTWRPWPIFKKIENNIPEPDFKDIKTQWSRFKFFQRRKMRSITKKWLSSDNINIKHDKFILERGGSDVTSVPYRLFLRMKNLHKNRFYYARKKFFRYFVEDSYENALKLANYCEYVFLMDQPYNTKYSELPHNIIRVKSWSDLYKKIELFG